MPSPVSKARARSPTSRGERGLAALPGIRAGGQGRVDRLSGARWATCTSRHGRAGIYEFIKWFYPQIRKEGLVVDGAPMRRECLANDHRTPGPQIAGHALRLPFDHPATYPTRCSSATSGAHQRDSARMATSSLPLPLRGHRPLIGKRTWGGVVAFRTPDRWWMGDRVRAPAGHQCPTGEWIIEGEGVSPTSRWR